MTIQKGWHKLSDRHKYHYFEEGLSLCLKYAWYPVGDEAYDDVRVNWEYNNDTHEMKFDNRLCLKCQVYHEIGKCTPQEKYLKCDQCGRFGAREDHEERNYYGTGVEMVCLCKECGTWDENSESE